MSRQNKQSIICPTCGGEGFVDGRLCQNCGGVGLGQFHDAYFLYWRGTLNVKKIKQERLFRRISHYFTFFLIIVLAVNFFIFLFWAYSSLGLINFFHITNEKAGPMFLFWLNIYLAVVLAYRLDREYDIAKIIISKAGQSSTKVKMPNNWIDIRRYGSRHKINVRTGFSHKALSALDEAVLLVAQLKQKYVEPLDLLFAALSDAD